MKKINNVLMIPLKILKLLDFVVLELQKLEKLV